jgi:hypothetical protein
MTMNGKSLLSRKAIKVTITTVAGLLAILAFLNSWLWYPGITPNQTAQILIKDDKFGGRALGMASFWGDAIFPALRDISNNYSNLNGRNTELLMMVFAQHPSEKSFESASELYQREDANAKAIGAAGLAAQGKLPDAAFAPDGYLYQSLNYDWAGDLSNMQRLGDTRETSVEHGLIIAGYAKNNKVLAPILKILSYRKIPYQVHAEACDALKDIGDKQAIPELEAAMRDNEFYAIPNAFDALIKLDDPNAIPLAIARITPEIRGKNSQFILNELEKVTGKNFGFDQSKWQEWWNQNKNNLQKNGL